MGDVGGQERCTTAILRDVHATPCVGEAIAAASLASGQQTIPDSLVMVASMSCRWREADATSQLLTFQDILECGGSTA